MINRQLTASYIFRMKISYNFLPYLPGLYLIPADHSLTSRKSRLGSYRPCTMLFRPMHDWLAAQWFPIWATYWKGQMPKSLFIFRCLTVFSYCWRRFTRQGRPPNWLCLSNPINKQSVWTVSFASWTKYKGIGIILGGITHTCFSTLLSASLFPHCHGNNHTCIK